MNASLQKHSPRTTESTSAILGILGQPSRARSMADGRNRYILFACGKTRVSVQVYTVIHRELLC